MNAEQRAAVEVILGRRALAIAPLSGGCVGDVVKLTLDDGTAVVAKLAPQDSLALAAEGRSLRYLADHSSLPVPQVLHSADDLLLMEFVECGDRIDQAAERDAARHLAALHRITADDFGFDRETPLGGLMQSNATTASWPDFFAEHRLLHRARKASEARRLSASLHAKIERLASRLDRYLPADARPSLIHGDCWSGNVLVKDGRVAAFIDPAIAFADRELELAFTTLFGTFGEAFFGAYDERFPIRPGFFEERRDLLNLYPLLIHVHLFGAAYVPQVESTLKRYL